MINIREYYMDGQGENRPGKKGISLSPEQWQALKGHMSTIDSRLKKF